MFGNCTAGAHRRGAVPETIIARNASKKSGRCSTFKLRIGGDQPNAQRRATNVLQRVGSCKSTSRCNKLGLLPRIAKKWKAHAPVITLLLGGDAAGLRLPSFLHASSLTLTSLTLTLLQFARLRSDLFGDLSDQSRPSGSTNDLRFLRRLLIPFLVLGCLCDHQCVVGESHDYVSSNSEHDGKNLMPFAISKPTQKNIFLVIVHACMFALLLVVKH